MPQCGQNKTHGQTWGQASPRVRIVLCQPSHPGNIGAAARAMKNMGFSRLCLVSPQHFPDAQATARAAGSEDILEKAQVTDNLVEAIGPAQLVYAASARLRRFAWPMQTPRVMATHVRDYLQQSADHEVALLLGNEQSGLDNAAFAHTHFQVHIPTHPQYASLNLGCAVQILVYELSLQLAVCGTVCGPAHLAAKRTHARSPTAQQRAAEHRLADAHQLHAFYQHLTAVLHALRFLHTTQSQKLLHRLYRLFNRAQLEVAEINILRGILSSIEKETQSGARRKR